MHMEWAITIFVFIGVIAVTAVVFVFWVAVMILKLILRAGTALAHVGAAKGGSQVAQASAGRVACRNDRCRAMNPATARFCRRCGHELHQPQQVPMHRAAMW
jgi:ribosomal protein L40E